MKLDAKATNATQSGQQLVVVLGVHRSGTSLAAHVLNHLGVRFGDKLIPGRADNPVGFWEHSDILQQTKAIETKLGLNPFKGGPLITPEDAWSLRGSIAAERLELKRVLERELQAAPAPFGFKDPRTLPLLPVWQEIFAELGVTPRFVLALRRPDDTAASIAKRGQGEAHTQLTWACQLAQGINYLAEPPAAVVHYEDWFDDPIAQARKLAKALNLSTDTIDDDQLRATVRTDLRHQQRDESDTPISLVRDLYDRVRGFDQGSTPWDEVRMHARTIVDTASLFSPIMQELRAQPAHLEAKLKEETAKLQSLRARRDEIRMKAGESAADRRVEQVAPRHPDPSQVDFPSIRSIRPAPNATARPLKICIATEDIVGPIRNGGIGTTYTHLASLLAEAGHDPTILYLRGDHCEDGAIEDWVEWYRKRGVRFAPVHLPENTTSPAPRWLDPMYALYEYLKSEHFDLVHVSEWRGTAYMCLAAKRQGLAFKDTVFCVKASSPWLWNREYGLHPIDNTVDLVKMYAERRSIEMADLVIGGSAHLLRWMLRHGYRLPARRTYVQPNVVKPPQLPPDISGARPAPGERVPVQEIVFFGRLEHRKGLDVFCEAVGRLLSQGVEVPPVTFLGKFGARIPTHPEMTTRDYLEDQAKDWPFEWTVIDDYQQEQALGYLHGEGRLAVMPSVIENSTLTVYEATHFRIPFIASRVGGTPELIREEHREAVLTEPHPVPLAAKLHEALDLGGFVAAPSFDNDANLAKWLNFHANMSTLIDSGAWDDTADSPGDAAPEAIHLPKTSVCLVLREDPHRLAPTVDALMRYDRAPLEVVLVDDGSITAEARAWLAEQRDRFSRERPDWMIFERPHYGLSAARNFAAKQAKGDYLLFIDPNAHPKPTAVATFAKAAATRKADILTCFSDSVSAAQAASGGRGKKDRTLSIVGDSAVSFYEPTWRSGAIFVAKSAFAELQGLTTDYKVPGAVEEFIARAVLANKLVETVPEALVHEVKDYEEVERYNAKGLLMRTTRPHIRAAPLCYEPLLMTARFATARWQKVTHNLRTLRQTNEKLREKQKSLFEKYDVVERQNQRLHQSINDLKKAHSKLQRENVQLDKDKRNIEQVLRRLSTTQIELKRERDTLHREDADHARRLLRSRSWRYTRPLRQAHYLLLTRNGGRASVDSMVPYRNGREIIMSVYNSASWDLTAPLRLVRRCLRRKY